MNNKTASFWPSFEEFLEFAANGSGDIINRLYGELTDDVYANPPEEEKESYLRNRYARAVEKLQKLTFPLPVYRKVRLKDMNNLRTEGVGTSWSTNRRKAQVIYGTLTPGKDYLLSAEINQDAVDKMDTIYWRMSPIGDDEDEVRLIQGAQVHDLHIWKNKEGWKPLGKLVTAARKKAHAGDVPSWQEFVDHYGGLDKVLDSYTNQGAHFEVEDNNDAIALVEGYFDQAENDLWDLTFPLTVYRTVYLPEDASIKSLRTEKAGVCWRTKEYDNDNSYMQPLEGKTVKWEIKARVTNPNDVDWMTTMWCRSHPDYGSTEDEIRLNEGAVAYVIGFRKKGEPWKPVRSKAITAAMFPTRTFKKLFHVGDMDIKDKQPGSLEGDGLSVSQHPEAWMEIARIGGPTWVLTKAGNRFLDFHRLNAKQRKEVIQWGVKNGYAEEGTVYRVHWYDEEMEEERYFEYTSREEAQSEVDAGTGSEIEEVPGNPIGTQKLESRMKARVTNSPSLTLDYLVVAYAEDVLNLDGVWWADRLDPEHLSAPRGVIFNAMLPTWKKDKVNASVTAGEASLAAKQAADFWHGGRLYGPVEIQAPKKGRYEAGPGLYLTTSYSYASKYAKGGKSTYLVSVKDDLRLADKVDIPLADGLDFAKRFLGAKGKEIADDLKANCERMKRDTFTANILINLVVNYEAGAGKKGLALLKFLVEHGVDAAIENNSGSIGQWVVVFNPSVVTQVKKIPASEVTPEMRNLPKVSKDSSSSREGDYSAATPDAEDYKKFEELKAKLRFPLTLYRAFARTPERVDFDGLGPYWTWDEDSARPIYAKDNHEPTVVRAVLHDPDGVDWDATFFQNVRYGWGENEVYLKHGADLVVTGIRQFGGWQEPEPDKKYVYASKTANGLMTSDTLEPEYLGNCTEDEVVERLFGDATMFAQALEDETNEWVDDNTCIHGDLLIKYDPETDIHSFYKSANNVKLDSKLEKITDMRELLKSKDADTEVSVPRFLYHATPEQRVASILSSGLEPRHENAQDNFSPRVYLTTEENQAVKIAFQLRKARIVHGVKGAKSGGYTILKVDTNKLEGIRFCRDGYYPTGVYTLQSIPANAISVVMTISEDTFKVKNWPKFWNSYFWGKTASPDFGYTNFNDRDEELSQVKWSVFSLGRDSYNVHGDLNGKNIAHMFVSCKPSLGYAAVGETSPLALGWAGTGLGQQLYDHAIAEAKNRGLRFFLSGEASERSESAEAAWKRLSKRYPVTYTDDRYVIDLNKMKTASPDLGYSQYNDRDADLSRLKWKTGPTPTGGVWIEAYDPQTRTKACTGSISHFPDEHWFVEGAYLRSEAWRGTGLGQLLYDKMIQIAKRHGGKWFLAGSQSDDAIKAWGRLALRYPVSVISDHLGRPRKCIDLTKVTSSKTSALKKSVGDDKQASQKTAIVSLENSDGDDFEKAFMHNELNKLWTKSLASKKPVVNLGSIKTSGGTYQLLSMNVGSDLVVCVHDAVNNVNAGYASFIRHQNNFEVDRMGFSLKYQGFGIGAQLYRWLIVKGVTPVIVSGFYQTRGGRTTWEKLAKEPGILVYGWNKRRQEAFSLDPNDLSAEEVIWSRDAELDDETGEEHVIPITNEPYDIVLVAIKKESGKQASYPANWGTANRDKKTNPFYVEKQRTDITNVIHELVNEFGYTPYEINNGQCQEFAEALQQRVRGATLMEVGTDENGDFNEDPIHFFVKFKGRYYDAEAPLGVRDWRNLPIFHNYDGNKGYEEHLEKVKRGEL